MIWYDIDYMDRYKCFTVDTKAFPDMKGLNDEVHDLGFHTVAIIDPGIKVERGYHVYESGEAVDAWVQDARGNPYVGRVWPGDCVFPDFTMARVREWCPVVQVGIRAVDASEVDGLEPHRVFWAHQIAAAERSGAVTTLPSRGGHATPCCSGRASVLPRRSSSCSDRHSSWNSWQPRPRSCRMPRPTSGYGRSRGRSSSP